MALQTFPRFMDLPREIQLQIWEMYEESKPHVRHYFHPLVYINGHLYAATREDSLKGSVNTRAG
ncbi:hypothetical protein WAJ64_21620, partial [Acinetobacter baumannii]